MNDGTMTTEDIGAYLRREAASHGYGTAQAGSLFLHITRYGSDWALSLCDETAIPAEACGAWQAAVGAPSIVLWRSEAHGKVCRCEWQGTEDAGDGWLRGDVAGRCAMKLPHVCTDPQRCERMEVAHTGMAAQLADALTERDRARAQVAERDATIAGLQEALCGANEGREFYYQQFCDKCKPKAVR